jgi:hypothetical protein
MNIFFTHNQVVPGSSPGWPTKKASDFFSDAFFIKTKKGHNQANRKVFFV